jgi:hypothetical protein
MVDRNGAFPSVDIFQSSSAASYIDYCSKPKPAWEYMEKPMWKDILSEKFDISNAAIFDVGSGAGKLIDLLVEAGANLQNILALEPNLELATYLRQKKGILCIKDSSHNLNSWVLQHQEYDLVTANMVANHLTTPDYDNFVKYVKGMLMLDGVFIYTIPFPEGKARKHNFDNLDNSIIVEEDAPWGGKVKYHHRSEDYQVYILQENGFKVERYFWGYESFIDEKIIKSGEIITGKNSRRPKRLMFIARKIS